MSHEFSFVFHLLEKENIDIDKNEFIFQIQSHPDYPSLLAISDTLNFFNVPNVASKVTFDYLEFLPEQFVVLLNHEEEKAKLYLIERFQEKYFISTNSKLIQISEEELKHKWGNIVLLIDKREEDILIFKKGKKNFLYFIPFLLFLILLSQIEGHKQTKFFFVFPILGLLFSIAALKDLLGTKSNIINKFCNLTEFSSCSSVIQSSKWKIFEFINFSDLSMIFFSTQFFGLLAFLFWNNDQMFFSIQKVILLSTIPILFLSIYYQKYIEKRWCPICLVIALIVLSELLFVLSVKMSLNEMSLKGITYFAFISISITTCWYLLKLNLIEKKELKEFQLESLRFKRNFKLFKSALESQETVEDASSEYALVLGNSKSDLEISLVTNPFCVHCKETHKIIEQILDKYGNDVAIHLRFNFNQAYDTLDQNKKNLYYNLIRVYDQQGESSFLKALHSWFENKNMMNWGKEYIMPVDEEKVLFILKAQLDWVQKNNLNFTPALIVGNFHYPVFYDRSELLFFLPDLIEESI